MEVKGPVVENPFKLVFTYSETTNMVEKQAANRNTKAQLEATLYFNVDAGKLEFQASCGP